MSLDQLLAVCPPPARAVSVPTPAQWNAFEGRLGTSLPADYKDLIGRYGDGCFGSEEPDGFFDLTYVLLPASPERERPRKGLPRMLAETETLAEIRRRWPDLVPHPVWPESGGLLYVAGTTTQHGVYWRTEGVPSGWTIVACDRGCETRRSARVAEVGPRSNRVVPRRPQCAAPFSLSSLASSWA